MDRRLPLAGPGAPFSRGAPLTLSFEGDPVRGYEGESVAVALFASGVPLLARSIKYHRPRSFFCLTGSCGACLLRIDGVPNVRACRTLARDGLTCERQNAFPSASHDVLGAIDWFFPEGMDHHTLLTGSRTLNLAMQQVVLRLAGLGKLPDRPREPPPVERAAPELLVVGGGPAGLAAATAAASVGRRTLLVDADCEPGGSLLAHPSHGPAAARRLAEAAREAGVEIWSGAQALAYYPDDEGGVFAVARPDRLALVTPRATLHATGAYPANALFPDNDRPGVMAGRAAGTLLVRHGVRPGEAAVVVGAGEEAQALAAALRDAGLSSVTSIDGENETILALHGRTAVTALDVGPPGGPGRRVACDLVAIATMPSPAFELARQQGAAVRLEPARGGFVVCTDDDGRTAQPGVFACGDVRGFAGATEAAAQGTRVGRLAALELPAGDAGGREPSPWPR